jgi:hypothetical protein
MQEGLDKKRSNTSSFLARSCFSKCEFNLKQHKIILAKSSAKELRKGENKQITSNKHKSKVQLGARRNLGTDPLPSA